MNEPAHSMMRVSRGHASMWLVLILLIALTLGAWVMQTDWSLSPTLEPLPETPKEFAEYPARSLLPLLNLAKLDQLTLESDTHLLIQRPIFQLLPSATVEHPAAGIELRLDWSDPEVYAEPSQAGGYRLIVFCQPLRNCYSEIYTDAPPVHQPVAFLRLGAEDATAARTQLEALRRLILLEGGEPSHVAARSLTQRLRELHLQPTQP